MLWIRQPSAHRPRRRPPLNKTTLFVEPLEDRVIPSVDVLTFHNDLSRTGDNLNETQLTPANVNTTSFGQLFSYPVDGQIYAQPLLKTNLAIPGLGTHDVVFVATENDSVYAFDANSNSGSNASPLWHDSFTNAAAGITAVPWQPTMQGDIQPTIGITSTPFIDPGTSTMYVVVKTQEVRSDGTHFVQRLHALDLTTGVEKFGGPALLGDTMVDGGPDAGYTDVTPIAIPGTGDGSDGTTLRFNALRQNNRCGLLLSNGVVYLCWAAHGDVNPFHGWLVGFNASTLKLVSIFCDTPDGGHGGIWMSGDAPTVDASGNLYFAAGDGTFDASTGGRDYGDCIIKLSPTPGADGQLPVLDYFAPFDQAHLSDLDLDEGSGGVLLLPPQPGPNPNLLVQAGKVGRIYLLNRNTGSMGEYNGVTDNVVQALPSGTISGSYDAPGYFNNGTQQLVYYQGINDVLRSFSLVNGQFVTQAFAKGSQVFGFPGASPSISANGTQNGIVWVAETSLNGTDDNPNGPAILYAYDATSLEQLYNSSQLGTMDQLGNAVKFVAPTIANGKVYIGTQKGLYVFGLLSGNRASDANFEVPALASGGSQYTPAGAPWAFNSSAGLTSNKSAFTSGNPSAPGGSQVAFVQALGSLSQSFMLPAGTFNITFSAAQRANLQASFQTFQVQIDGSVVSTFNSLTGINYTPLTTASFAVLHGSHTLVIQGTDLNGGDNTVFIDQVAVNFVSVVASDASFASPVMPTGGFQYNPPDCPWIFAGSAGLAANGSAFTSGNPAAPDGNQIAFIQGQGSFSQNVGFTAGTFALSFSAAQRANEQTNAQTFEVLIDGTVVASFNNLAGAGYTTLTTPGFNVTAGNHTIAFLGTDLNGGDNTVFFDVITITALPPNLGDSSFESPVSPTNSFLYDPAGGPWNYAGHAGVAYNASAFTINNANAPQGNQVAFLQNLGIISQSFPLAAGTYNITFCAAQRGNFQASGQTFQVLLDGTVVATINSLTGITYTSLTTSSFTVAAGVHTLVFQGTDLNSGDNTVLLDQVQINALATGLNDAGFETPAIANSNFQYNPTGGPWTFVGTAGLAANTSTFSVNNGSAPQGNQVAFIQNLGSIRQSIFFPAGTYDITFSAAQRGNFQASSQTFQVLLDGTVIGTFNNVTGTNYTTLTTSSFTVTASSHTLTFQGTDRNTGDNTVLIDQVAINVLPTNLNDTGFESPALANGAFQYNPSGAAWTFFGHAGLATNGSAFTAANANAPQGNQVAFVQNLGSVGQSMFLPAGTFNVSFAAAQRGSSQASAQTFQVLLDNAAIGTFNNLTGSRYTTLTTSNFTVAAGVHKIVFQGTDLKGGDNTVLLDQVLVNAISTSLSIPGFEIPALPPGGVQYNPAGTPWTYSGSAGLSANGSAFTSGNPNAPEGNQVAFIQSLGGISQIFSLPTGTFSISFGAAQRGNVHNNAQTFEVLLDGNIVGTFNNFTGTSYQTLITSSFTVAAGRHTVAFLGTNLGGGDNTVFLDQVTVNGLSH
jgi:hypothetical protein